MTYNRLCDFGFLARDGADTFRFLRQSFGRDTIGDFDPAEGDRLNVRAADDVSDLTIRVVDGDTRVRLDADSVVILEGFTGDIASHLVF